MIDVSCLVVFKLLHRSLRSVFTGDNSAIAEANKQNSHYKTGSTQSKQRKKKTINNYFLLCATMGDAVV